MRGRWTDIVVAADYSYENTSGGPTIRTWVNGQLRCSGTRPLVNPAMVQSSRNGNINLRYGIYNSFVSRWLDANKTRPVSVEGFSDVHSGSGGVIQTVTSTPFEVDWGVQLPTQVVYYDAVRVGSSRAEVDVRLREGGQ